VTTAIPTTAAELEEMLGEPDRMQNVFKDKTLLTEFIRNYAKTTVEMDPQITAQIKAETQRVMADWLRENEVRDVRRLNLAPGSRGPKDRAAGYNAKAAGAQLDPLFESPEDFLRAIWHGNHHNTAVALRERIRNDFSSTVPADGGFLVPESLRSTLLQTSLETSIVRPRAMVVPMETARVPFPVLDSTTNVSSVFGGMIAYWTEESAQLQRSSAKFGRVVLDAKKLTGYSVVPNELFADSILSFAAFLAQTWPKAISFAEDSAFFDGTGVGEPLGFMRGDARVQVTKEAGQAADTIVWENIVKMFARMLPTSLGNAIWVANIETFPELATMAQEVGTGGSGIWINNGQEGPPARILGRPVIFTEKANALGDAGDINFVDLSYYLIGDRQQMQMATSEHVAFDEDGTAVRIIERADGRPWLNSAITPKKGSNTLSPIVQIAART
jgi:HK97 family phage major capsid protein